MKSKTYDEWKELGYQVRKGEKATGRNPKNQPTFTRDQVDDIDQPATSDFPDDSDERIHYHEV